MDIKEYLSEIPQEDKKRFLVFCFKRKIYSKFCFNLARTGTGYYFREKGTVYFSSPVKKVRDIIDRAFPWEGTPEGGTGLWSSLNSGWKNESYYNKSLFHYNEIQH